MMTLRHSLCFAAMAMSAAAAPPKKEPVMARSDSGLDFYAQGGVVVDGVAYFTSDDHTRRKGVAKPQDFPAVVAFDVSSGRKLREYGFGHTYDSSPLVVQRKDGTWLVVAHEHEKARTVAMERDTGKLAWTSEANHPGFYFFGYSWFERSDGVRLVLAAAPNGLHALSSETGEDVWHVPARSSGGVTPCVDQKRGWIFYQCQGKVMKIDAAQGKVLAAAAVPPPNTCISWNTVLTDDGNGYAVVTRWYGKPEWDSAIRVYDAELNLKWERTALPSGKKDILTYAEGLVVTGCGNGWSKNYSGADWKKIHAYRIGDGDIAWTCDLSEHDFNCVPNVPYFDGHFYAETQDSPPRSSKLFRIQAGTGAVEQVFDYGRPITACAPAIVAQGRLLSGDLWEDRIVVTQLATGTKGDWPGPFGNAQTNQYASTNVSAPSTVKMRELRPDAPQEQASPEK
jgi:hypothetical protein